MSSGTYIHIWDMEMATSSDWNAVDLRPEGVTLKKVGRAAPAQGRPWWAYSTSDDLYVRTDPFDPTAFLSWDWIELEGDEPAGTSLSVRAHDGTDSWWWDGGAWAIAGASEWNTVIDFNTNLPTLPIGSIAIEIRLLTTIDTETPTLTSVGLRWTGHTVDWLYEWIYSTIVSRLESDIRPLTDMIMVSDGTADHDLADYEIEPGLAIASVDAVYDHIVDPGHATDLFDSFNGTVITTTAPIPVDNKVWARVRYAPQVAVRTSPDYSEQAKVPAVWITSIGISGRPTFVHGARGPKVIDRGQPVPQGSLFVRPLQQARLNFRVSCITARDRDLPALLSSVRTWVENRPTIKMPKLADRARLIVVQAGLWQAIQLSAGAPAMATMEFSLLSATTLSDPIAAENDGEGQAVGVVDAGNPDFPGVGFGIKDFDVALIRRGS